MQIHELNTFSGKPGELDYLAIDTGFDTAKISADKLLESKVNRPIDEHNQYDNGTAGQLLRSKGDGSTEWSDVGQPTDAQTAQAISDWLDAHPEATTTVQDGSLTKDKFSATLKGETLNDYVTPEMFGAVGDGLTDDSIAVQAALDTGKYVHCENTYLIKDIVVTKEAHIVGGKFIDNGSSSYMISFDDNGTIIDNVTVENAIFDGQNGCNGISLSYCNNAIIRRVEAKNFKVTAVTCGIYINRSSNVVIDSCHVHNLNNSNSQPTRGILSNRSIRTQIINCIVHDVSSGSDGDGIQIIYDGAVDETSAGCIVSYCKVYNCTKRYIKIQQKHCIIENCTLLESDSTIQATDASIAIYDCDCTVKNNLINGYCVTQIAFVGSEIEEAVFENTLIEGNLIKSISTDSSFALIGSVTYPGAPFRNLSIIGNTIVGLPKFVGITLRNLSGDNLNISNNNFYNVAIGVYFRYDTGQSNPTINNAIISNNNFKDIKSTPIYFQYTEYHCNYLSITGNVYNVTTGVAGRLNIVIFDPANYDIDKITVENNIGNGYDGWLRVGPWSLCPTGVPNGFRYFNTNTGAKIWLTFQNSKWYAPDGTEYTP